MVTVVIEEILEIDRKFKEINNTDFKDIIFITRGGKKVGWVVQKLDEKSVRCYQSGGCSITDLIITGHWEYCIKEVE